MVVHRIKIGHLPYKDAEGVGESIYLYPKAFGHWD